MPSQTNSTKDFVGVLTGDDKLTVFADGELVGRNGGYWSAAKWFSFSSKTKIIAVSVTNIPGGNSGFLGIFSNGVVTDDSWKCKETQTPENGWQGANYSDDTWRNAYIRYSNTGPFRVYGIPPYIRWISPANISANKFICRRRFNGMERVSNSTFVSFLGSKTTYIFSLYLDGVFMARTLGSLTRRVKGQHQLQAVQVEDSSADYLSFLASSSNGIRTTKNWRCTNVFHDDWFLPSYDDSSWPRVFVSGDNNNCLFIAPDAKWIGYALISIKMYCRQNTNSDPALRIPYNTPSAGNETPFTSSVPQVTSFPTNSIDSTKIATTPSSATKHMTRTASIPVSRNASSQSKASGTLDPSSIDSNRLSTLMIVVIAVSGGVAAMVIGLAVPCYIWRKRRNRRENNTKALQKKHQATDKWEMKSGDVTVCEELGHGAFGKVLKGIMKAPCWIPQGSSVQQTSKKTAKSSITVAVKMLQENATPDQKNDFLDEINLMKAVGSHKNIVSFIGCCIKSSPNFLVVEFASKGDLLSYLKERRKKVKDTKTAYVQVRESPPPISTRSNQERPDSHVLGINDIGKVNVAFSNRDSRIDIRINSAQFLKDEQEEEQNSLTSQDMMSISWQIAQGMEYISGKGIVHRDLAARNVLVCDNKLVKVADFGLARRTLGENVYHVTGQHNKFPVKWMSPEAINDGISTAKSDVWSYGIVLWEIATLGGFPYPGIKNTELTRLLRRGYRMEKPDTCSEEFYQLMTRCWADNPDARPTFTELCQVLEDWMQRDTPYLDMDQVDEDQLYYDASAAAQSSGSLESPDSNTIADNLAFDHKDDQFQSSSL
ncbi:hypothetical protein ACROYT_G009299 [Oculina patagonica]